MRTQKGKSEQENPFMISTVATRSRKENINILDPSDQDKVLSFNQTPSDRYHYWLQLNDTMLLGDYFADGAYLVKPFITCLGWEELE